MGACEHCFIKNDNEFSTLLFEELEYFTRSKTTLNIKKGENIVTEGHVMNGIYCLKNGKCKLSKLNTNGKSQIVKFLRQGNILGQRSVLSEEPSGLTITALEDMQVCFIPKTRIMEAIKDNPVFSLQLIKNISHQLNEANESISMMAQKSVKERLADVLLKLHEIFGTDDEGYIDIRLTREEMANTIGTATESAIRLLSNFKASGLLEVKGRRIKIVDLDALDRASQGYN
ncbi:MAG TPA: Crp/Fnr family transcriptional regulator [Lutibacter sp.]|nr:Crp/Fnr family transcriptional regulator [Lutibacter sp.]